MSDDLKWYTATRRDSKAHVVINEIYMEKHEREFERIREFDTAEEAVAAYEAREMADRALLDQKGKKTRIAAAKVRGDIKKGSMEDEALRARMKEELRAELMAEMADKPTSGAASGPKTRARTAKRKAAEAASKED